MKDSTINKIAGGTFLLILAAAICFLILIGWGFIEVIQWLTSK